jgi:glutathione S-transferase
MFTLYHHAFCPFSRAVRIALGEYGIGAEFREERVWERRAEFLQLNPAGTLPVLIIGHSAPLAGPRPIGEFLDETKGPSLGTRRLMPDDPYMRAEVRRLLDWFDGKFDSEVTSYLVTEKVHKRFMTVDQGGGPPDTMVMRAASANLRHHLGYVAHLAVRRNWLAGERLTLADIAAAAHLSIIDYMGDVPWEEFEQAKVWYARIKSRPSFRPLLTDRIAGIPPSPTYVDLDF